jgi:prepilin-type N-terminal cleavage/methylation domain-containing protein
MRAFTMLEIVVVASIGAILASGAMVALSSAAKKGRTQGELTRLLSDVSSQRAAHVASGRTEPLTFCVDCVNDDGTPNPSPRKDTLDVFLAGSSPLAQVQYDLDLSADCGGQIHLNALGRSVDTGGRTIDCSLRIVSGNDPPSTLGFTRDGRLKPSFADDVPPEPAHAQDLSSRTTPVPMRRGRFTGDATRAPQLELR